MNSRRWIFLLSFLMAAGAGYAWIGQRSQNAPAALGKGRMLGSAVRHDNLALFPVYDSAAKPSNRYLTLDDGLKAKSVKVREKQGGGQVSAVLVSNRSTKPLYLMSGEVVLGGQQDRVIGDDTIIPPQAKNVPVRVFCVEHGRWSGRTEFDQAARSVAVPSLRNTAQEGAYMAALAERPAPAFASGSGGGRALRVQAEATASKAQQEVWDKVAAKNRAFKAETDTGTYRGVVNMEAGEAAKSVTSYYAALSRRFPQDRKVVGAVAAVNGRVIAADIFGDPTLFRKLWPKLLRSYAAEAAEAGLPKTAPKAVSSAEAVRFIKMATESKDRSETRTSVVTNERFDSKDARAYRTTGTKAGGFGGGAAVHESVIRK